MEKVILYGTPGSLYTGKARSYLIKAGVPYQELTTSGEHYQRKVKPLAKTPSVPVIELASGEVIRDGTLIIDHFQKQKGYPFTPQGPKQQTLSLLFDLIGSEGLLRPAMHYRWDFLEVNKDFLANFFESMVPTHKDKKESGAKVMNIMKGAGQAFGAIEENFVLIESLYLDFLRKLDLHFRNYPYLFGGKPSVGDFGLLNPMYAHLGRDPAPLAIMQREAVSVYRWVERMNRADADMGEYDERFQEDYLVDDEVPDSLVEVLTQLAKDFVPETIAAAQVINEWLVSEAPVSGTPIQRGVGFASFEIDGKAISALAQPYRFFLLKRVQDYFESLGKESQENVRGLLVRCELEKILDLKLDRDIDWVDNRELWA